MARIKIEDLPKNVQISQQEMKNVLGGVTNSYLSQYLIPPGIRPNLIPPGIRPINSSQ
jgi:hypothetical protein